MHLNNVNTFLLLSCFIALASCGGNSNTATRKNITPSTSKLEKQKDKTDSKKDIGKSPSSRSETLSYNIETPADDAQQNSDSGEVSLAGEALALGDSDKSLVALRFSNINIPKNTPIVSAYIQLSAHKNNADEQTGSIKISVEDSVNSAPLKASGQNLSNRVQLSNSIFWNTGGSWKETVNESGKNQRTPNLKELVQEIVNKKDWNQGNAISFLLKGSGLRNAISYEGSMKSLEVNDLSARLVITLPSLQEFKPNNSTDDAEENLKTGKVDTKGADLELGWENTSEDSAQRVGIRFHHVNITPKSKIHKAYIQFTQDEDKNANPFSVTIQAEDSAAPKAFKNENKNLSKRKLLKKSVAWSATEKWTKLHEAEKAQRTPDLTQLVQELVNKDEWKTGSPMAFFIDGKGTRTAESFESGPDKTPKLVVEYTNASTPVIFDKTRIVWNDDPTSTMSIIWNQYQGNNGIVYYDEYTKGECPTDSSKYSKSENYHHDNNELGMHTIVARLTGLKPDTGYRFIIKNDDATSECSWFRTAPNTPKAFSYISGGDTKSSGTAREVGRWSNRMVSKVRPLFVFFTGDYNSGLLVIESLWKQWLDDWSTLTRSEDGRIYPLITVHGNHENGDYQILHKLFDAGNPNSEEKSNVTYNAFSFGGNLLYLINLNSELHGSRLGSAPIWRIGKHDKQTKWFESALKQGQNHSLKVVGYHKPMRPHTTAKSEAKFESDDWAPLMEQYGVDIAYESDTHNHKITYPIRLAKNESGADEGFIRDDQNGIMYVGEGSWGANPRKTDDSKDWTLDAKAFNQIKLNRVYPAGNSDARIDINVIKIAGRNEKDQLVNYVQGVRERSKPMALPEGVTLHKMPKYGTTIGIPFKAK